MIKESCMLSLAEMVAAVQRIIARGHDAEVRAAPGGKFIVYELDKTRVCRGDLDDLDDLDDWAHGGQ